MWRAILADGRVETYDGSNSPQAFLDQIVEFQVVRGGAVVVSVRPDQGERVVYRRRVTATVGGHGSVAHVVGIVNLEHGLASLVELGEDGVLQMGFVPEVEFTAAEVA